MTDIADDAAALEQRHRDAALAARPRVRQRHGTDECVDCGDPIPAARKAAIWDADRCATCQAAIEKRGGR